MPKQMKRVMNSIVVMLIIIMLPGLLVGGKVHAAGEYIYTIVGNGTNGVPVEGAAATSSPINSPFGMVVDNVGNLYFTEGNSIWKMDVNGILSQVGATGTLHAPRGIALNSGGTHLYIAEMDSNRIRELDLIAGTVATVAGTGTSGFGGDGGLATSAMLNKPNDVTLDGWGNIYIADSSNHRIRKVDAVSGIITTVAGTGTAAFSGDEGQAILAKMNDPDGIAVDSSGNVYIADRDNNKIRKIDTFGIMHTLAGITGYGYSGDGGPANLAQMRFPTDVVLDSTGNLYIADGSTYRVRKIDLSGTISAVAGTGVAGSYGDGGLAVAAELSNPAGVAVDLAGNLYIADADKFRIRKLMQRSSNANLSDLTLSGGTALGSEFAPGTIGYMASVANNVASLTVTPTVADSTATIKVNGTTIASGAASGAIALNVGGANVISVEVTAQNGTTKTYTVTVTRAGSSNADLNGLTLSGGTALGSEFAPGTIGYMASVANNVASLTVTPTVADSTATIKVNGTTIASGAASGAIVLNVGGANAISVEVTAQNGTTKTYIVTVTRAASSNADLNGLTLSAGTELGSEFASGTIGYTASVANEVTTLTVTATVADSTATIKVNGTTVASGAASGAIALNVGGANAISAEVTAQNGTTKTYSVTVTRAASSNANLNGLALSGGTELGSEFASGTIGYTASVANDVTSLTVTATVADSTAKIKVNGTTVASGTASWAISLNVGSTNEISVEVTAQNGTTKTYTVTVTRAESGNADLINLALSDMTLSPIFDERLTAYMANVANSLSSISITPTVSDAVYATVTASVYNSVDGLWTGPLSLMDETPSAPLPITVGSNTISVVVMAQDGTTKTYTVVVTRAESSNADLSGLTVSKGTLSPTFTSSTIEYTASATNSMSSITITPTVSDAVYATVTGSVYNSVSGLWTGPLILTDGTSSAPLPLTVGSNTISVVVTAQDGTTNTYTVMVTRVASSNADLSGLTLSAGTLSPTFASSATAYTASVANSTSTINITPTVSAAVYTSVTVSVFNSAGLTMGPLNLANEEASLPLPLSVGSNLIQIIVMSEAGTTKQYTVTVTRAASSNNSNGGSSGNNNSSTPADTKPGIDLNGIMFDPDKIDTAKPSVTLTVTPDKDGMAFASIPASVLTSLGVKNPSFFIEIKAPYGSYQVPVNFASLIPGLMDLLSKSNLKAEEVSFKITLIDKSDTKDILAAVKMGLPKSKVIGSIVDFNIEIINTKTKKAIGTADLFSEALTRIIPMPSQLTNMPEQWGSFRYNETTKLFEFVPAKKVQIDGVWYMMIRSYSNSVYMVAENAVSFTDVQQHWSQSFVELAAAKGLVDGVGNSKYDPDRALTRAEFTAMLVRSLGNGTSTGSTAPYDDVNSSAWYFNEVANAKKLGLLDFANGKSFMPNQPLTREEMASMLAAVITREELPITKEYISLDGYKDITGVEANYLEDIRMMVKLKLMTGTGADTFDPKGEATRAQAAVVFIRTLHALGFID